jgi:hypothetical protein
MPTPPDAAEGDASETIDAGPEACAVDLVCPERTPNPGAFCEGELECEYPAVRCTAPWIARCQEGRWGLTEPPLESCEIRAIPLMGERCRVPFAGTAEGTVSVVIPRDRLVIGTQGSPMIAVEIALEGDAAALDCVHIVPELRVDGVRISVPSELYLRLRCGSTTGYLVQVFADDVCDGAPHEADVTIDVEGVGSASATTTIVGCD